MAMARKRPDGLYDVEIPGGMSVPMSLSESQIQSAGIQVDEGGMSEPPPVPSGGMSVDPGHAEDRIDTSTWDAITNPVPAGAGGGGGIGGASGEEVLPIPGAGGSAAAAMGAQGVGNVSEETVTPEYGKGKPAPGPSIETEDVPGPESYMMQRPRPRVVNTPAMDVRAAWTHELGSQMPEGFAEDVTEPSAKADDFREAMSQAKLQGIAGLLQDRETQLNARANQIDEERAKRAKLDAYINGLKDDIDTREGDLRMATNPTEENYWKEKGVVARLISGLSVALGGYMQGLSGSPNNMGYQMQQDAINQWIMDQKGKYERLKGHRDAAKNAYAEALDRYGSPESAELGMRVEASALQDALTENRLRQLGLFDSMIEVRDQLAANEERRQLLKQQILDKEKGRVVESWKHIPASSQVIGGMKPKDLERMVILPDGSRAWARDPKTAREASAKVMAYSNIMKTAAKLRELNRDPQARNPASEAYGRSMGYSRELYLGIKNEGGLGAWDVGAAKLTKEKGSDPTELHSYWTNIGKLDALIDVSKKRMGDLMRYQLHADPQGTTPFLMVGPGVK